MLNKVSERTTHYVRWALTIGWLLLIASMFYDPVTTFFTRPEAIGSPFRLDPAVYLDPTRCVKIREQCVPEQPYSMTVLMWWAMIVPAGIFILFVFGHEFWRRICPLSFLSQLPRALGLQRKRKVVNPITQEVYYEVVTIGANSWLGRNYLYVQFSLFILGLGIRILFVNGHRASLGFFLILTILCAILVGYLYAGKSWCQYFCPMAPVQMIYTGPRSLLGSQAHLQPRGTITQSTCRVVDSTGVERNNCVGCKSNCIDIDAEKSYWENLKEPGRRLVQYGYLGMVIAFYFYYFLYAGNWDYYFTGAWTHEEDLLTKLFDPGFYINGQVIPIPKAIAVYLTYFLFVAATFYLGLALEKLYRRYKAWRGHPVTAEQAQHVVFTIYTLTSFWIFFSYGARPSLNRLPAPLVLGFNALIVAAGAIWIVRTLKRAYAEYQREKIAVSLRRQLVNKIRPEDIEGRSIEQLTVDEVYAFSSAHRVKEEERKNTYLEVVRDFLEQSIAAPKQIVVTPEESFEYFAQLRERLDLKDEDHTQALQTIAATQRELFETPKPVVDLNATTIARRIPQRQQATATIPLSTSQSQPPNTPTEDDFYRTSPSRTKTQRLRRRTRSTDTLSDRTTPLNPRNRQHR